MDCPVVFTLSLGCGSVCGKCIMIFNPAAAIRTE